MFTESMSSILYYFYYYFSVPISSVQEKHLLLLYFLCQSLCCVDHNKLRKIFSRDGNTRPPDLPPEKSVCRSGTTVRTGHGTTVQFSRSVVSDSLRPQELQHAKPPCPSLTPRVHADSRPSSQWCHPAISSSVVPFSSCPQSLPASESFPMSQFFASGGQSIRVSALASVLPRNIQDFSPLEWTGWISLQSKGLSRVFSNTTVQKHQFFGAQPSSQSNSLIHTWPLEKP